MKVTILRTLGKPVLKKLGCKRDDLIENATIDVDEKLADALFDLKLAERAGDKAIKAVPPKSEIKAN